MTELAIRVVYVEDDERLARLTMQYFASHGLEVTLVTRGDQAVAEVLRVRPCRAARSDAARHVGYRRVPPAARPARRADR